MKKQDKEAGVAGKAWIIAMAGAAALTLAACDQKPATTGTSKGPENAMANSSPGERPAPAEASVVGDATLAARVKSALVDEPALKQSLSVDVSAANGVVTLFGTAANAEKSHQAAIVALNVEGVRSVKNELVVLAGS